MFPPPNDSECFRSFVHLIGARVGLEQIFYNVAENIGFVDLCAVVYEPVIDCPIEFPFAVQLSTIDNTAGMTV